MVEKQIIQRPPLSEDCVFALDIGTRSVIGIVGRPQGQLFEVIAIESREHPQRAMIDGQIEDIRQVAHIAGEVKEALEEKLCCTLTKVNVAAAGRALKPGRNLLPPGRYMSWKWELSRKSGNRSASKGML